MNTIRIGDRDQLYDEILRHIQSYGTACDLNHLDVSQVEDMSQLFEGMDFQGDISKWDVSNVTHMNYMFHKSSFNGDISQWNVSKVKGMTSIFSSCAFNGDISKWNLSSLKNASYMFANSSFQGDISDWNTSNIINMCNMFEGSIFQGDISRWDTSNVQAMHSMFKKAAFDGDIASWDVQNLLDAREAFSEFRPNILGYLGVLVGEYLPAQEHPMRAKIEQLRAVVQSFGMEPLEGASFMHRALHSASLGEALQQNTDFYHALLSEGVFSEAAS